MQCKTIRSNPEPMNASFGKTHDGPRISCCIERKKNIRRSQLVCAHSAAQQMNSKKSLTSIAQTPRYHQTFALRCSRPANHEQFRIQVMASSFCSRMDTESLSRPSMANWGRNGMWDKRKPRVTFTDNTNTKCCTLTLFDAAASAAC